MPKFDPIELIVGLFLVVVTVIGIAWATKPLWDNHNQKAVTAVTNTVTASSTEEATKVEEKDVKVAGDIQRTSQKVQRQADRLRTDPDGDSVFFNSVCESSIYRDDPQCSSRNGGGQ